MGQDDNILDLLREEGAEAARRAVRGVILQPGAIGDCVLTLPLAGFMKDCLELGGVDILGHAEYIGILPGRTCVDGVRSIDSVDLHRLFSGADGFDLTDGDGLINVFADYSWVVTFMGEPGGNFEQNLVFTVNCSHSAEVITLSLQPSEGYLGHISEFYMEQFITQSGLSLARPVIGRENCLIEASEADVARGGELMRETGVDLFAKLVVIQPGSGGEHKCWYLDNFLSVAEELVSKGTEVIFLLGPAELERFGESAIRRLSDTASCLTELSLTDVLGLLSCADGFVGNDSGITHLAGALGVKTVAVFGPTDPDVYGPMGAAVRVFTGGHTAFAEQTSKVVQRDVLDALTA